MNAVSSAPPEGCSMLRMRGRASVGITNYIERLLTCPSKLFPPSASHCFHNLCYPDQTPRVQVIPRFIPEECIITRRCAENDATSAWRAEHFGLSARQVDRSHLLTLPHAISLCGTGRRSLSCPTDQVVTAIMHGAP